MITNETYEAGLAGAGQKLLAYSKSAAFTARRGLVVEIFPFIFGAAQRMSAKAISEFLAKEQGIQLSAVTINKALKDPHKNWNLFFDSVEESARTFAEDYGEPMQDILFRENIFFTTNSKFVKAAAKMLVKEDVSRAAGVLKTKWYTIDLAVRLKARQFLAARIIKKKWHET